MGSGQFLGCFRFHGRLPGTATDGLAVNTRMGMINRTFFPLTCGMRRTHNFAALARSSTRARCPMQSWWRAWSGSLQGRGLRRRLNGVEPLGAHQLGSFHDFCGWLIVANTDGFHLSFATISHAARRPFSWMRIALGA